MEQYTHEITLDFNTKSFPLIIYAKQGDANERVINVHLMKDGEEYILTGNEIPILRVRKPDGTLIGNAGTVVAGTNSIAITLTAQTLAAPGRALVDILLYDNENNYLSTASFILDIQRAPAEVMEGIVSANEFAAFSDLVAYTWPSMQNALDEARTLASQMTMQLGQTIEPGQAPSLYVEDSSYILKAPSVKYVPQVSVTESIQPSVTITVTSGTAGTGEESKLVKNLNFAFKLPSGVIPADAIGSGNIQDSAVTAAAISAGAVTSAAIASSAVTAAAISAGAVTTNAILDGAITSSKIYSEAVETGALASGAVTYVKLADDAVRLRTSAPITVAHNNTVWVRDPDETYEDYPFRGKIELFSGERDDLNNFRPEVFFDITEIQSNNFAPVAATYSQGVYIYAKATPSADIIIPMIELWR